jgi:murein peptide amidase A
MNFDFQGHRVHDYSYLIKRWKSLARKWGLRSHVFATGDDFDLMCFRSPVLKKTGGIYLSAGIHGDEPAATEGLYQWAALHGPVLRELPLMIFPCLNPWGLVHNRRNDRQNCDLNRCYHLSDVPRIEAQKELLRGYIFRLAMCLHEDYDAQGVYLYEIRKKLTTFGQELLSAAGYYIPVDLRRMIEGRRAEQGWIARRVNLKKFPEVAEAIYVGLHHSERTITAETPSEYDLSKRIEAQIAMIQRAIELSFV